MPARGWGAVGCWYRAEARYIGGTGLRCGGMPAHGSHVPLLWAAHSQLKGPLAPAPHQHHSPCYWEVQKRLLGSTGNTYRSLMYVLVSNHSQCLAGECRGYECVAQKPTKGHQNIAKDFVWHLTKVSFSVDSLFALALYKKEGLLTPCLMIFISVKKQNINILVNVSAAFSANATLTVLHFREIYCFFKEVPTR